MSQENVDRALELLDAFNRRDLDAFVALADDGIEVESRLVAMEGGYHGHQGLRTWWRDFLGAFPDYRLEVEELRDLGDVTLGRMRGWGHGADSATPLVDPFWIPMRWRDGQLVWWRNCSTEAEALEAVGLGESAMSRENVELLRRMFELFSHQKMDWDSLFQLLDPDIVWEVRSDFPDAGIYSGYEGVRQLSETFAEAVEQTWYLPLEYIATGNRVVVPLRWGGLGIGSGAAFAEREETWVFTLRDGRIRHVSEYATKREALEAVGLRE